MAIPWDHPRLQDFMSSHGLDSADCVVIEIGDDYEKVEKANGSTFTVRSSDIADLCSIEYGASISDAVIEAVPDWHNDEKHYSLASTVLRPSRPRGIPPT